MNSLAGGCATQSGAVRDRFEAEYDCGGTVTVREYGANTYRAVGCGHSATYVCAGAGMHITCIKESQGAGPAGASSARTTASGSRQTESATVGKESVTKDRSGKETGIRGKFGLKIGSRGARVHLYGVPQKDREHVWVGIQIATYGKPVHSDCQLKIVSNGKPVPLPDTEYQVSRRNEEIRIKMPLESLVQIGSGQRVIGRLCEDDFQMRQESLDTIKKFLVYFEEELVLLSDSAHQDTSEEKAAEPPSI